MSICLFASVFLSICLSVCVVNKVKILVNYCNIKVDRVRITKCKITVAQEGEEEEGEGSS